MFCDVFVECVSYSCMWVLIGFHFFKIINSFGLCIPHFLHYAYLHTPKVGISYFPICDLYIRSHVNSKPRTLSIINVACTLLDVVHVTISYIWLPFIVGNFRGCRLALGCAFYTFCTLVMRKLLRWVSHASLILKLKYNLLPLKNVFIVISPFVTYIFTWRWPHSNSLYCQCQIHIGGSGVM